MFHVLLALCQAPGWLPAASQAHALPALGPADASARLTLGDAVQWGPVRVQWDLDPLGQRRPTLWLKRGDAMEQHRAPEPQHDRPTVWEVQAFDALWILQGDQTLQITQHRLEDPLPPLHPELVHAQAVAALGDCDKDDDRAGTTLGTGVWHVQFFDDGGRPLCTATVGAWSGHAVVWP